MGGGRNGSGRYGNKPYVETPTEVKLREAEHEKRTSPFVMRSSSQEHMEADVIGCYWICTQIQP